MKRTRKKLAIGRQTLRALAPVELRGVDGALYEYWRKSDNAGGARCQLTTDPNPTGCVVTCGDGGCLKAP